MTDEIKKSKRGGKRPGSGRKRKGPPIFAQPANTSETGVRDTKWKPGQSGNPNGRPKVVAEIRDLARAYTHDAITTLAEIMRDKGAPPAARVAAVSTILDRGYGKPTQNIRAAIRDPKAMSDAELVAFLSGDDEAGGGEGVVAPEGDPPVLN